MPLSSEIKLESLFCVKELIPLFLTTWLFLLKVTVTDIQIRYRRLTYEKQISSCQFQGHHELLREKRMHFRNPFTVTSHNKTVRNFMIPLQFTSNHSHHSLWSTFFATKAINRCRLYVNMMSLASLKIFMFHVGYSDNYNRFCIVSHLVVDFCLT